MEIIDNFLEKEPFKKIQQTLMGKDFAWFYQKTSNYKNDGISQLTHSFYNFELPNRINSPFFKMLNSVIDKLEIVALIRIKANLTYPSVEYQPMHTDYPFKNIMSAIYYINSNDGGTKIKQIQLASNEDKIIQSKENRMVIISGDTPHAVVRHTDDKIGRIVINFNYYSDELAKDLEKYRRENKLI